MDNLPTVLAIDDSPTAISMYQLGASKLHINIVAYNSAEDALPYLDENKPDLIFLDIMMPGMDGLTMLQELREKPLHKETPVIVVTSKNYEQDKNVAKAHGAVDYIAKPISIKQIIQCIVDHTNAKNKL